MSEVRSTIPFDRTDPKYRRDWERTQEEQDAFDDLNRRKVNPQLQDYVQNNELICFGISEHTLEERSPQWSPKALREIAIKDSWQKKGDADQLVRPSYDSTFNDTSYATRSQLRVLLGFLFIRELPIRNFYVRATLMYGWVSYFLIRGVGRGLTNNRPIVLYNHDWNMRALMNHPDVANFVLFRVLPRNPPIPDPHKEWMINQKPVFHQYHKNVYRYRFRKPRYVQWDGSTNQPVMPYLMDVGTDVANGTFKRNCNTVPQLK